jgi:hypothetical protein
MADEILRRNLDRAFDPGMDFPNHLLLSRTMAMLASVGQEPRRRTRWSPVLPQTAWRLVAATLALLIVAATFGVFLAFREYLRPYTVNPPAPSPSANASPNSVLTSPGPKLTQPLSVSAATPVILFNDSGNNLQVDGMTWDGQSGKLTEVPTTQYGGGGASSNPAGTLFVSYPSILDRSGKTVATLTSGPEVGMYFVGTWADDEQHYCQVMPFFGGVSAVPGTLQLTTPGGTPRDVARVGMQAAGENTLTVSACSVQADRAVVIQFDPYTSAARSVAQLWVVQLSSGRVLWTHNLAGKGIGNVVASRDGRYVAEVQTTSDSTVYGPNGSSVGHVSGWVQTFSWDGSLAVVVASGGRTSVIKWSDGTVIWTAPAGEGLAGFQPEPGGSKLAVLTMNGALYVVSSDGREVAQSDVVPRLLGCLPKSCTALPQGGTDVRQVLPRLMVGDSGWSDGFQRTTDGGLHWQDVSPPFPPNGTKGGRDYYLLDADHAWATFAVADQPNQFMASGLLVVSTADGGRTWNQGGTVPVSGAGSVTGGLGFIDAQHGWLFTDSGTYALGKDTSSMGTQPRLRAMYATADGGLTWSQLASAREGDGSALATLGLGCSMSGLTFINLSNGWLTWDCNSGIGPPGSPRAPSMVAVTRDGGRTWQPVDLPSFPSASDYCSVQAPVFTSSQGVLPSYCGGVGAVYATGDGGRTWSLRKAPFFSQKTVFADAKTGWAFASGGTDLYRTTDGGSNWAVVKRFAPEQNAIGLSFVDTKVGFAMTSRYAPDGKSGYSTMWKTTDGGQTWSVMSSQATGPLSF